MYVYHITNALCDSMLRMAAEVATMSEWSVPLAIGTFSKRSATLMCAQSYYLVETSGAV